MNASWCGQRNVPNRVVFKSPTSAGRRPARDERVRGPPLTPPPRFPTGRSSPERRTASFLPAVTTLSLQPRHLETRCGRSSRGPCPPAGSRPRGAEAAHCSAGFWQRTKPGPWRPHSSVPREQNPAQPAPRAGPEAACLVVPLTVRWGQNPGSPQETETLC